MAPCREVREIHAPRDQTSKTPENSQPNRAAMCGLLSSPLNRAGFLVKFFILRFPLASFHDHSSAPGLAS
ncbi:hypothetical protein, partial [Gluconacetobacter diazotrophicus]|uniref:hypothetical protein n=1 Tax=Gluconacetobacter diazotrophicus TaxID=33996 RepID=UPI001C98965D